jgi:hypothetical protein
MFKSEFDSGVPPSREARDRGRAIRYKSSPPRRGLRAFHYYRSREVAKSIHDISFCLHFFNPNSRQSAATKFSAPCPTKVSERRVPHFSFQFSVFSFCYLLIYPEPVVLRSPVCILDFAFPSSLDIRYSMPVTRLA